MAVKSALSELWASGRFAEIWRLARTGPPRLSAALVKQLSLLGFLPEDPRERELFRRLVPDCVDDPHYVIDRVLAASPTKGDRVPAGVALSPEGGLVAALTWDHARVRFWDPVGGDPRGELDHGPDRLGALDLVRLGRLGPGGAPAGLRISPPFGLSLPPPYAVSPDGARLFCADPHGPLRAWDLPSGRLLAESKVKGHATSLAVSPDSARLAVGRRDGATEIRDVDLARAPVALSPPAAKLNDWVDRLCWSPDGRFLAVHSYGNGPSLWDLEARAKRADGEKRLGPMVFSPDGRRLALYGGRFADAEAGSLESVPGLADCGPECFSPDGRRLLAWKPPGRLGLWDFEAGDWQLSLSFDGWSLCEARYARDGALLIVGIYGEAYPCPEPLLRVLTVLDDQPTETMGAAHLQEARRRSKTDASWRFLEKILSSREAAGDIRRP